MTENRCLPVVLDWDLRISDKHDRLSVAKANGTPVVLVCRSVCEAFLAGEPYADVYLEKPVNAKELRDLVIALTTIAEPDAREVSAGLKAAA